MISQKQKLGWVTDRLALVNEALGTEYFLAMGRFIMYANAYGGNTTVREGTLDALSDFLDGILFHVALVKKGNKNNGN
jgi:hypothetical protein